MKFPIVATLLGLSQSIKLGEKLKNEEVDKMHALCKNVHGIEYPHASVLVQLDSQTLPIAEKKDSGSDASVGPVPSTNNNTSSLPGAA